MFNLTRKILVSLITLVVLSTLPANAGVWFRAECGTDGGPDAHDPSKVYFAVYRHQDMDHFMGMIFKWEVISVNEPLDPAASQMDNTSAWPLIKATFNHGDAAHTFTSTIEITKTLELKPPTGPGESWNFAAEGRFVSTMFPGTEVPITCFGVYGY